MTIWVAYEELHDAESLHVSFEGAKAWAEGAAGRPLQWAWDRYTERWEAYTPRLRFQLRETLVHP